MNILSCLFVCFVILISISYSQDNKTKNSSELFPIEQNGKWGFIDRTGKIIINPQFDMAGIFSEGLAGVKLGDDWGFIDKTGKMVWKSKK